MHLLVASYLQPIVMHYEFSSWCVLFFKYWSLTCKSYNANLYASLHSLTIILLKNIQRDFKIFLFFLPDFLVHLIFCCIALCIFFYTFPVPKNILPSRTVSLTIRNTRLLLLLHVLASTKNTLRAPPCLSDPIFLRTRQIHEDQGHHLSTMLQLSNLVTMMSVLLPFSVT
jgi:hypothetical protein